MGRCWERPPLPLGKDSPDHPLRDVSTCVVLTRGDDLPPGLLTALERLGIEVLVIGRPVLAFVELLQLEKTRQAAEGWGLARRPRFALLIADRERWGDLSPLLRAARRHLPEVGVWIGTEDLLLEVNPPRLPPPSLRLTPREPDPLPERGPSTLPDASERTEHPLSAPSGDEEPGPRPPRNRPALEAAVTPEEIEMLLRLFPDGSDSAAEESDDETRNPPRSPDGLEGL